MTSFPSQDKIDAKDVDGFCENEGFIIDKKRKGETNDTNQEHLHVTIALSRILSLSHFSASYHRTLVWAIALARHTIALWCHLWSWHLKLDFYNSRNHNCQKMCRGTEIVRMNSNNLRSPPETIVSLRWSCNVICKSRYDTNARYPPRAAGIRASIERIHRVTLLFQTRRKHHLERRMENKDDMDKLILDNFYFNKLFDNNFVIKISW